MDFERTIKPSNLRGVVSVVFVFQVYVVSGMTVHPNRMSHAKIASVGRIHYCGLSCRGDATYFAKQRRLFHDMTVVELRIKHRTDGFGVVVVGAIRLPVIVLTNDSWEIVL